MRGKLMHQHYLSKVQLKRQEIIHHKEMYKNILMFTGMKRSSVAKFK